MSDWFIAGTALFCFGFGRILDHWWVTKPWPWPAYLIHVSIGIWLMTHR